MSYVPLDDSIYKVGTIIQAREAPERALTIMSYYRRIYYCMINDEPRRKYLAYFEWELVPLS